LIAQETLLPRPRRVEGGDGAWSFRRLGLDAATESSLVGLAESFRGRLARRWGLAVPLQCVNGGANLELRLLPSGALPCRESYVLNVSGAGAAVSACAVSGLRHGLETLLQLVRPSSDGLTVPAVRIEDSPRFAWRGLLLDPVRHWLPIPAVKRTLEAMAAVKLNVFHWHLTDDQGFRIESRTFPRLHAMAGGGRYYTHRDVEEIVRFAEGCGIRVVPELDMPGHATSWVVAYPELGCGSAPATLQTRWGIFDVVLNPARETTYDFIRKLLAEMAALFPDDCLHIGGDEVNGVEWLASDEVRTLMDVARLETPAAVQRYFTRRVSGIVTELGKRPVVWQEAASAETFVQTYKPLSGRTDSDAAAVIISEGFYLDLLRSAGEHYAVRLPEPAPDQPPVVIGGEACLWSEFVTEATLDTRLWPRAAAVAERLWSWAGENDHASLYRRLDFVRDHLRSAGVDLEVIEREALARLAPAGLEAALGRVVAFLEPVKDYVRHVSGAYTVDTPLDRLVDHIAPEAAMVRRSTELWTDGKREEVMRLLESALTACALLEAELPPSLLRSDLEGVLPILARSLRSLLAACSDAVRGTDAPPFPHPEWMAVGELLVPQFEGKEVS
jgi:hexosaminidase